MRKTAFFLAAAAAALCTVACNKDFSGKAGEENISDEQRVEVPVFITGAKSIVTKSSDADFDDDHSEVANIQFFVFNRDNELEVYKKITSGLSTTLSLRYGSNAVYAVVNAPDITGVSTKAGLLAVTSSLTDNANHFVMLGYVNLNIPDDFQGGYDGRISVYRLASRVVVKKVTADFTNPAYAAASCNLVRMFLVNAVGDGNLGRTAAPSVWYAKQGFESVSGIADFLSTSGGNHDLNTAPFETACYHYCYPNPTTTDTSSATWSPRHTRIVIEVQLAGDTFYYPITLPELEFGKSYEIENLTITRKGSTNPDTPVEIYTATYNINVKPWTVVPVTSGVTI